MRKTKMTFCRYVSVLFCVTCQIDDMDQMKVEISARQGGNYVRFLAQALSDPSIDLGGLVRDKFDHGMARTRDLMRGLLADLPPEVVEQRIRHAVAHFVHALADKARRDANGSSTRWPKSSATGGALFVANLVDTISGALTASVSDETLALVTEATRKTA